MHQKIISKPSSGMDKFKNPNTLFGECTIVDGGSVIMAKIFGVFGTKTCCFIKENRTKTGPLVFCTVLCSKHDEKLGNWEGKNIEIGSCCSNLQYKEHFCMPNA